MKCPGTKLNHKRYDIGFQVYNHSVIFHGSYQVHEAIHGCVWGCTWDKIYVACMVNTPHSQITMIFINMLPQKLTSRLITHNMDSWDTNKTQITLTIITGRVWPGKAFIRSSSFLSTFFCYYFEFFLEFVIFLQHILHQYISTMCLKCILISV